MKQVGRFITEQMLVGLLILYLRGLFCALLAYLTLLGVNRFLARLDEMPNLIINAF